MDELIQMHFYLIIYVILPLISKFWEDFLKTHDINIKLLIYLIYSWDEILLHFYIFIISILFY